MNPIATFFASELAAKLSLKKIGQAFDTLAKISPYIGTGSPAQQHPQKTTVAAVQLQLVPYSRLDLLIKDLNRYIQTAVEGGAQLVCFPEFSGLLPAFISSGASLALDYIKKNPAGNVLAEAKTAGNPNFHDIKSYVKPFNFVGAAHIKIMATFAQKYNIYISCGSSVVVENNKLYNRHTLLAPSGATLAQQDKIHLTEEEIGLGATAATNINVVSTPLGNIALMVCMDASYFETFKIAKSLGADFAIVPIANMEEYNYHLALRGAQSRVDETGLVAIKSAMVSKPNFPLKLTGKAGVHFPLESGQKSKEASSHTKPEVVISTIDIDEIRNFKSKYFIRENHSFNSNYYDRLLDFSSAQFSIYQKNG